MERQRRSDLGLADLALLLKRDHGLPRGDVLALFGYPDAAHKPGPRLPLPPREEGEIDEKVHWTSPQKKRVPEVGGFRPRFWQVLDLKSSLPESDSEQRKQRKASTIPGSTDKPRVEHLMLDWLPSTDLLSPRALYSRAEKAALCAAHARVEELQQWVRKLSRAEVPDQPRSRQETVESGEVWIVLDYDPRLMVWWEELSQVGQILRHRFGRSRARIVPLESGDLSELGRRASLPWPGQQTRLLVFSDLGALPGTTPSHAWQTVLQRWMDANVHFTVFLPHTRPAQEIRRLTADRLCVWDRAEWEPERGIVPDLLACLSMVQWCSPSLLRCWRRLLHGLVQHDYLLWHHPQVWRQPGACGLLPGIDLRPHRERFAHLPATVRNRLLAAIALHRADASRWVLMEEAHIRHAENLSVPGDHGLLGESGHLMVRIRRSGGMSEATGRWLKRLSSRQDRRFWEANPGLERACLTARRQLAPDPRVVVLGPGMSDEETTTAERTHRYTLSAIGEGLGLDSTDSKSHRTMGTELLDIQSGREAVTISTGAGRTRSFRLAEGGFLPVARGRYESLRLRSDRATASLRQVGLPPWADAIEQGPEGLYCTLPDGRRLRWCYPGEGLSGPFDPLASPEETARAAWISVDQLEEFARARPLPHLPLESGGSSIRLTHGSDQYGEYAALRVGDEALTLRWIPPGEFRMGSPEDEPERSDNETPHRVVLSRGFWLAETACPQALWRAVTGEDPSRFKGGDLPVESVSWEEVQGFCRRLNERVPGLGARLPSEAEWEYACRAGSGTPFWWGERLSPELANYNGNFPYAGGPKGEYREKTVAVKSFEPNPWGLYQMHGNVWEWCEDWYGDYTDGETVDPTGPEQGEARVLRGGSWYYGGRWLRAAYRFRLRPVVRDASLGFRLAAGPRPGGAGESGGDEDAAASGSGSGRRSRGSGHSGRG